MLQLVSAPLIPSRYTVKTGSCELDAVIFRSRVALPDETPTLVLFQANRQTFLLGEYRWILEEIIKNHYSMHVLMFDYPGTGRSRESGRLEKDLAHAGHAAIALAQRILHTPKNLIHLLGRSLGGAVATIVKSDDPQLTGCLIADRTFRSMKDVISAHATRPISWLFDGALKDLEFCAGRALKKIRSQGHNLILYHPDDDTIPISASLFQTAKKTNVTHFPIERIQSKSTADNHNDPLCKFRIGQENSVTHIFNLFNPPHSAKIRGSIQLIHEEVLEEKSESMGEELEIGSSIAPIGVDPSQIAQFLSPDPILPVERTDTRSSLERSSPRSSAVSTTTST